MASTKFSEFVASKKLDIRRILTASHKLEKLRPEDKLIKLKKRKAKKGGAEEKAAQEAAKPRSGRPVTQRAIHAAMAGQSLQGPVKTRIVRAINTLLAQKKQDPIQLRDVF